MRYAILYIVLVFFLAAPVRGDELDALLGGFDFEEEQATGGELNAEELLEGVDDAADVPAPDISAGQDFLPVWLDLQGSVRLRSAVNFAHDAPLAGQPDYRGLSMFRTHGELVADSDLGSWKVRLGGTAWYDAAYHLNDQRGLYSDNFLDEYEREAEFTENYLQGSLADNLDLKIGRQIVVWGKSDNIRVTDVLNPLDRRWPGMTDIRYLRLPVTMTRLDYFTGAWSITGLVIHEPRFDKYPEYNGEFFPGNRAAPPIRKPDWAWDNQQVGMAVNGIFSSWDISLYGGYFYQQPPYLVTYENGAYRIYKRAGMVGMAVNVAIGNWLLKGETAYWDGLRYANVQEEKSRLDILAGVEYSGFTDTTISLEIADRHICDYDSRLRSLPDGQREDWVQYAIRFSRKFLNDTLQLNVVLSSFGLLGADGGFERFQLDYDINDHLTLATGVIFYESGDHPGFTDIGDNDKAFMELKYSF